MMATRESHEPKAADALVHWATLGLSSTLASSVELALRTIADTGACRGLDEDWVVLEKSEMCMMDHLSLYTCVGLRC